MKKIIFWGENSVTSSNSGESLEGAFYLTTSTCWFQFVRRSTAQLVQGCATLNICAFLTASSRRNYKLKFGGTSGQSRPYLADPTESSFKRKADLGYAVVECKQDVNAAWIQNTPKRFPCYSILLVILKQSLHESQQICYWPKVSLVHVNTFWNSVKCTATEVRPPTCLCIQAVCLLREATAKASRPAH